MSSTSAMQALFQFAGLQTSLFSPNSRYWGIATETLNQPNGATVSYIGRRFVPQPGQLAQVQQRTVVQGDRLDILASQYFADPTLFWRICDANGALRPEDVVASPGTVLRICLPAGIPGGPVAP